LGTPCIYAFPAQTSPLYVAELLDWVDRVATDEGPRLIQDAGKDGTVALTRTLDNLRVFTRGAMIAHGPVGAITWGGVQPPHGVPRGYATPRVQRAVRELADAIYAALQLASQIRGLHLPNE
jgi:hypothetical protein